MLERLGNVLYWLGCLIGIGFFVSILYQGTHDYYQGKGIKMNDDQVRSILEEAVSRGANADQIRELHGRITSSVPKSFGEQAIDIAKTAGEGIIRLIIFTVAPVAIGWVMRYLLAGETSLRP